MNTEEEAESKEEAEIKEEDEDTRETRKLKWRELEDLAWRGPGKSRSSEVWSAQDAEWERLEVLVPGREWEKEKGSRLTLAEALKYDYYDARNWLADLPTRSTIFVPDLACFFLAWDSELFSEHTVQLQLRSWTLPRRLHKEKKSSKVVTFLRRGSGQWRRVDNEPLSNLLTTREEVLPHADNPLLSLPRQPTIECSSAPEGGIAFYEGKCLWSGVSVQNILSGEAFSLRLPNPPEDFPELVIVFRNALRIQLQRFGLFYEDEKGGILRKRLPKIPEEDIVLPLPAVIQRRFPDFARQVETLLNPRRAFFPSTTCTPGAAARNVEVVCPEFGTLRLSQLLENESLLLRLSLVILVQMQTKIQKIQAQIPTPRLIYMAHLHVDLDVPWQPAAASQLADFLRRFEGPISQDGFVTLQGNFSRGRKKRELWALLMLRRPNDLVLYDPHYSARWTQAVTLAVNMQESKEIPESGAPWQLNVNGVGGGTPQLRTGISALPYCAIAAFRNIYPVRLIPEDTIAVELELRGMARAWIQRYRHSMQTYLRARFVMREKKERKERLSEEALARDLEAALD